MDGLSQPRVLLGDGNRHVGDLIGGVAVEGTGRFTQLVARCPRKGRRILLGLDLQLAILDTNVHEHMNAARLGEIGVAVALGVHEVSHRQLHVGVDRTDHRAGGIVVFLVGVNTAVCLDGDIVVGGEGATRRAEDVGGEQIKQVGVAALDLGHTDIPVAVRNHGGTRGLDGQRGGLTHVVAEATGGEASVAGDDRDDDISREGLVTGNGGVGTAVALGGDGDVVGHVTHAGTVCPGHRPVYLLILGGGGLDGGGKGLLEGIVVLELEQDQNL